MDLRALRIYLSASILLAVVGILAILIGSMDGSSSLPEAPGTSPTRSSAHRFVPISPLAKGALPDLGQPTSDSKAAKALEPTGKSFHVVHEDGRMIVDAGPARLTWGVSPGDDPHWILMPQFKAGVPHYQAPKEAFGKLLLFDLIQSDQYFPVAPLIAIDDVGSLMHLDEMPLATDSRLPESVRERLALSSSAVAARALKSVNRVLRGEGDAPDGVPLGMFGEVLVSVVDQDGAPLGEATIDIGHAHVRPDGTLFGSVLPARPKTGHNGVALVQRCKPGNYTLSASKAGWVEEDEALAVEVRPGRRTEGVVVIMLRGFRLYGSVSDSHGIPVADAGVAVVFRNASGKVTRPDGDWPFSSRAQTTPGGEFVIRGVGHPERIREWMRLHGSLALWVTDRNGQCALHEIHNENDHQYVVVREMPVGMVRYQFVDPSGIPIEDVEVMIEGYASPLEMDGHRLGIGATVQRRGVSTPSGMAEFRLPRLQGYASFKAPGWVFTPNQAVVIAFEGMRHDPAPLVIVGARSGSISVNIPPELVGGALLAARIKVGQPAHWLDEAPLLSGDQHAALDGLEAGEWLVGAKSRDGRLTRPVQIVVPSGGNAWVDLRIDVGGIVHLNGNAWQGNPGSVVVPRIGNNADLYNTASQSLGQLIHRTNSADTWPLESVLFRLSSSNGVSVPAAWVDWGLLVFSLRAPRFTRPGSTDILEDVEWDTLESSGLDKAGVLVTGGLMPVGVAELLMSDSVRGRLLFVRGSEPGEVALGLVSGLPTGSRLRVAVKAPAGLDPAQRLKLGSLTAEAREETDRVVFKLVAR